MRTLEGRALYVALVHFVRIGGTERQMQDAPYCFHVESNSRQGASTWNVSTTFAPHAITTQTSIRVCYAQAMQRQFTRLLAICTDRNHVQVQLEVFI